MHGTYEILHIPSGRSYIGSSDHVERRLKSHRALLRRGAHDNIHLQRLWARDGAEAFEFRPLASCALADIRAVEAATIAARDPRTVLNLSPVVRRGAPAPNATLTLERARALYERAAQGERTDDLARDFGVSFEIARRIVAGRTYRSVTAGRRAREPRQACGERIAAGRLTAEQVLDIRRRLAAGEFGNHVARDFGVTHRTVYLIRDRRIWAHV